MGLRLRKQTCTLSLESVRCESPLSGRVIRSHGPDSRGGLSRTGAASDGITIQADHHRSMVLH